MAGRHHEVDLEALPIDNFLVCLSTETGCSPGVSWTEARDQVQSRLSTR